MCLDFIDLNKACPKDPFPIPQMSFLDAFQGYRKIPLALGDQEKNNFCHSYWKLPLQGDAFWFEKCKVHLLEDDDYDI